MQIKLNNKPVAKVSLSIWIGVSCCLSLGIFLLSAAKAAAIGELPNPAASTVEDPGTGFLLVSDSNGSSNGLKAMPVYIRAYWPAGSVPANPRVSVFDGCFGRGTSPHIYDVAGNCTAQPASTDAVYDFFGSDLSPPEGIMRVYGRDLGRDWKTIDLTPIRASIVANTSNGWSTVLIRASFANPNTHSSRINAFKMRIDDSNAALGYVGAVGGF